MFDITFDEAVKLIHGAQGEHESSVFNSYGSWDGMKNNKDSHIHLLAYAIFVYKKRCSELEDLIKDNPFLATLYARGVIKGRWPEAEKYIPEDSMYYPSYKVTVIDGKGLL